MIDNVLDLIKEAIVRVVDKNPDVLDEQKEQIVDVASKTLGKGLEDNVSSLSELLSGESPSITEDLKKTVGTALVEKVGLNTEVAEQIAFSLVPAVLDVLSRAMGGRKPLSLDSLADVVTGFSSKGNKKGGLLKTITSFFKK